MKENSHVTKEDIRKGLSAVGIRTGDIVFAHSSLSSFGYVEGGADAVIDALLETVGDSGTVVVPTFTWGALHNKEKVVLDLANAPVKSEVGIIPETFRKRKGAVRSRHICHSVAAIGPRAKDVMGEGISSFGKGSTFHQLYELDSWYLFLGVNFSCCTGLHGVEEYMEVPYRHHRDFKGSFVILEDGTKIPSQSIEFLREPGFSNDFSKMNQIFADAGIVKTCKVGNAKIINVRTRDMFDVATKHMREDVYFLLNTESRQKALRELT